MRGIGIDWQMVTNAALGSISSNSIDSDWGLALRLTRKHAHGQTLPVPNRPAALRWLIADSWLRQDLEKLVESICSAESGTGTSYPSF